MNEKDTERRNRFFEELSICLQREGFTVQPQGNGLLPVLNNGMPLCWIEEDGGIRYKPEDITDADMELARDQVALIAGVTAEYMKQMESAPVLKASGLDESYKILAEFNGVLLVGHPSSYGIQFVTWEWGYNHTGVYQGHYAAHHYEDAKRDFAIRSGLLKKEQLFSPEQLIEIYRCCADMLVAGFDLSYEQEKRIRSVQEQIEQSMHDLAESLPGHDQNISKQEF